MNWLKQHWQLALGSVLGLVIILHLLRRASGGSAASSSADISGGANQVQALSAAASLQNAQVNGQVSVAEIQGAVAAKQIEAQVQSTAITTGAQLQLGLAQTQAQVVENAQNTSAAVSIQKIQTAADVTKTQIEGTTLEQLAKTAGQTQVAVQQAKNQVALAQITSVDKQVSNIMTYSKHASQDYTAFAPIAAVELGQPSAAAAAAAANAQSRVASSTGATISSIAGGVSSILTSLFA
jgi:hypothetical protein